MIRARHQFELNLFQTPTSAQDVASAIMAALEPEDARHLAQWIAAVFHGDPGDNYKLRRWGTLLRHCRHRKELWSSLFSVRSRPDEALARFERSTNIEEFDRCYDELTNQPLSDWDLHLYAICFFDDDDSEGSPNGPYLWIAPTVRDFQALEFWRWLLQAMDGAELEHLRQRAEQIKQQEALTPTEALADPMTFVATL